MRIHSTILIPALVSTCMLYSLACSAQEAAWQIEDPRLREFLKLQTTKVADSCLATVSTLEDWKKQRPHYLAQLKEMLGVPPMEGRPQLQATVTQTISRDGVVIENLHYQSLPGLYVTGTLYRPEKQSEPLPAILYVCGHGRVKKNDISYGNKATYQHHGAWFAKNGYVCLIIDTIQLGEFEGTHHGTYRKEMWWWQNRGYTPAGVEAWNGIRGIDYLQSRPEVDGERIGITGRSGGGAYSWWVAALDERVKAAVPVAGITSMQNHIVDGCIEGHCDCMYMVNTYAWDFPLLAALIAPRPLLISNTDKDRIFPLDGVVDVYTKTRRIYELYKSVGNIGLNIAEGPHKDTQELRVNAFHWMNRFLKKEDPLIEITATKLFAPEELKVFATLPEDQRVTTIHDSFVPMASEQLPGSQADLDKYTTKVRDRLAEKSFRNLNQDAGSFSKSGVQTWDSDSLSLTVRHLQTDDVYSLPVLCLEPAVKHPVKSVRVVVCDTASWAGISEHLGKLFPAASELFKQPETSSSETLDTASYIPAAGEVVVLAVPHGIGPTAWGGDARKQIHIKRRMALLGFTLDCLRIQDVVKVVQAVQHSTEYKSVPVTLEGTQEAAGLALIAAIHGPAIQTVKLKEMSADFKDGPYLLQVSQVFTKSSAILAAADRSESMVISGLSGPDAKSCKDSVQAAAKELGWKPNRLQIAE